MNHLHNNDNDNKSVRQCIIFFPLKRLGALEFGNSKTFNFLLLLLQLQLLISLKVSKPKSQQESVTSMGVCFFESSFCIDVH